MFVVTEANALPTLDKMHRLLAAFEDNTITVPEAVEVFEDLNDNYGESAALEAYHKYHRRQVRPGLEFNEQFMLMGAAAVLGAAAIAAIAAIVKMIKKVIAWFKGGGGDSVESLPEVDQAIRGGHVGKKLEDAVKDLVNDAKKLKPATGDTAAEGDKKDDKKPETWEEFRDSFYEKHCASPYLRLWIVFADMDTRYDKAVVDLNHCNALLKKFDTAIGHAIKLAITEDAWKDAEKNEVYHSARGIMAQNEASILDTLNLDVYFPITEGKPAAEWQQQDQAPVAAARLITAISKVEKHFAIDFAEVNTLFETFEKRLTDALKHEVKDKTSPEYFQLKATIAAHQTAVRITTKYIQSVMKIKAFTQGALRFTKLFIHHYCGHMDRMGMSSTNDNLRKVEGLLKELETTVLDRIKTKSES